MKNYLLGIGSFMVSIGSLSISLTFTTELTIFQPITPQILLLLAGSVLLLVGLILPDQKLGN